MIISVQPLSNILHFEQTWSKERTGQTWEQGSQKKTFVDGSSVLCPERENVVKFPRSSLEFETLIKAFFLSTDWGRLLLQKRESRPYPMLETPELGSDQAESLECLRKNKAVTALCWTGLDDQPLWGIYRTRCQFPFPLPPAYKLINTLARLLATASMPPFCSFFSWDVYCILGSAKYAMYFHFPQFLSAHSQVWDTILPSAPPKLQRTLSLGCNGLPANVTTLQFTNCSLHLLSSPM